MTKNPIQVVALADKQLNQVNEEEDLPLIEVKIQEEV